MKKVLFGSLTILIIVLITKSSFTTVPQTSGNSHSPVIKDTIQYPEEKHFNNVRQLTFGGDNAEAYFSFDSKWLIFQKTNPAEGIRCDQIYIGKIPVKEGEEFIPKLVSTGKGRTTCGAFMRDGLHVIYASTHLGSEECPPVPDRKKYGNKYIWPLYPSFDIFMADLNGNIVKRLTSSAGYDAEATISPDGKKMIYTSTKDGDIELYIMNIKTGVEKRITHAPGYDGGAWFSPDGKKIIWRASRPTTEAAVKEYHELLSENLVAPTNMEIWIADAEGNNARQVSHFGQANWAPAFLPDSKRIIFASNHEYKRGFPFNLYLMDDAGKNLQKISRDNGFDAFPMFSPNRKKLVFCSNRNNGGTRDTNIFIADWVE